MHHADHERLLERPIIGPSGEDSVNAVVMHVPLAIGVLRDGHALPLPPGIEHLEDPVKGAMIAPFALDTTPRY